MSVAAPRPSLPRGVAWLSVSQLFRQLTLLISTTLLARLLSPTDFGVMSIALVVAGAFILFRDFGLGASVIHAEQPDEVQVSTLFWLTAALGIVAAVVLVATAPVLASLFGVPELAPVLTALGPAIAFTAIGAVPQAILEREFRFKTVAMIELAATVLASIVAIWLAVAGLGIWSLVAQFVVGTTTISIGVFAAARWVPMPRFSWPRTRAMLAFSTPLVGYQGLNFVSRNADNAIIGATLGPTQLGYYSLAYRLMLYPLQIASSVLGRVMFPAYAREADVEMIRARYLRLLQTVALLAFPMLLGMVAVAGRLIIVVFGEQWAPAIPVFILLAPVGLIQVVIATGGPIYQARGRTDLLFRWGVIWTSVTVVAFIVGVAAGIVGVAAAYLVATVALCGPGLAIPYRLIGLRLADAFRAVWRPLVCAVVMFGVVVLASVGSGIDQSDPWGLILLVAVGVAIYGLATLILNRHQVTTLMYAWRGA